MLTPCSVIWEANNYLANSLHTHIHTHTHGVGGQVEVNDPYNSLVIYRNPSLYVFFQIMRRIKERISFMSH